MTQTEIPHLRPTKTSAQLIVRGQPFLMLPCEVNNSSFSSAEFMKPIWPNLKKCNFNTVLGSVTWEMIEPVEGQFNFEELDKIIQDARQHKLHLVLLWFGSYKNSVSSYVPGWVKKDFERFPRVHIHDEKRRLKTTNILSPFSQSTWEPDAKAFTKLMRHIREVDKTHSTVLMVQVENECGVLGDSRDRSLMANQSFHQPVPAGLLSFLSGKDHLHPEFERKFPGFRKAISTEGPKSWEQVFGEGMSADEMFMAYGLASYLGKVAEAGKKEYPLPMFNNVWLNTDDPSTLDIGDLPKDQALSTLVGGGTKPGAYPSGGPCPHTLDFYKYLAPALDFQAPDVYLQKYGWACEQYTYDNKPLFIPEQRADGRGARRAWLAYGTYKALGCSPFGIDDDGFENSHFTKPYGLLAKMSKYILEAGASETQDMFGVFFDEADDNCSHEETWERTMGDFHLTVTRCFTFGTPAPGYGIIIHRGQGSFLLIGQGYDVKFTSAGGQRATYTGVLEASELVVDQEGNLSRGRMLNGDERGGGEVVCMPSETRDLGGFPIWSFVPARTMVAECTVYSISES